MRIKLLLLITGILSFINCEAQTGKEGANHKATTENDMGQQEADYPYPMTYSAKFKFADPEKGKMVLNFCKDFENMTLKNSNALFAERVNFMLPKFKIKASRDSALAALELYRKSMTDFKTELDVIMSVTCTDKNEDWVLLWAVDKYTDKNQVKHAVKYQQVWGLNIEGKVYLVEQFDLDLN